MTTCVKQRHNQEDSSRLGGGQKRLDLDIDIYCKLKGAGPVPVESHYFLKKPLADVPIRELN